ncbi:MAG TPA: tetratricopeptide repeat protein [Kofleriaceae bacterium]|jgi:tetratricopeptide (TPR) repeat protein
MTKLTSAIALSCMLAGVARADTNNKAKADELFKRAKKLLAEHKYAEACAKFEQSNELDPAIGAELNIGRCYEEWNKLAHAYHAYVEAERQAKAANDPRAAKIHELVAAVEPKVPRLVIHLPAGVDPTTVSVSIDGQPVPSSDLGNPQLVDAGPKQVDYAAGNVKKQKLVPVESGGSAEVTLDVPAQAAETKPDKGDNGDTGEKPDKVEPKQVEAESPGRNQRIAGIAVGGAGIVGIGIASYLALSARSNYNNALTADCMGMKNECDPAGLTATHDARSRANIATVVGAIGIAAVAGGVVLYLLAPDAATGEHAFYVVPTSNGLAFGGRL